MCWCHIGTEAFRLPWRQLEARGFPLGAGRLGHVFLHSLFLSGCPIVDGTLSVPLQAQLHGAGLPSWLPSCGVDRGWRRKKRSREGCVASLGRDQGRQERANHTNKYRIELGLGEYVVFL